MAEGHFLCVFACLGTQRAPLENSAARDWGNGGRQIPFSVMMPEIRLWWVTSKAGLKHYTPAGAMGSRYHRERISSGSRCSMGMWSPSGQFRSMVEVGPST